MVSEKKIVELVGKRRTTQDTQRTTGIKWITKAHPEHSSCELKYTESNDVDFLIIHVRNVNYYDVFKAINMHFNSYPPIVTTDNGNNT